MSSYADRGTQVRTDLIDKLILLGKRLNLGEGRSRELAYEAFREISADLKMPPEYANTAINDYERLHPLEEKQ